jgi:hypothetical protein
MFKAHFSNSKIGTVKKRFGQNNCMEVPTEYFKSSANIFCWIIAHDEETDGHTIYVVYIPIQDKADIIDVEPILIE